MQSISNSEDLAISILKNKKALVFCGGGVLGIAHCSALKELVNLGLDLKNIESISGSSVGAILAMALACGADIGYLEKKMDIDLDILENRDFILIQGLNLLKNFGLGEKNCLEDFISDILCDLLDNKDITFKGLYEITGKWLTVTYLSLNYGRTIFADHIYEPDTMVREAVLKSCNIPIFYTAYKEKNGNISLDGGIQLNYPMIIPRLQKYTTEDILGFNFISNDFGDNPIDNGQRGIPEEWQPSPSNIIDFLYTLVEILRKQAMKVHVHKEDWMVTVKVNVGNLRATQYLNIMEKEWLISQGKSAIKNYIQEFNPNKFPLTHL